MDPYNFVIGLWVLVLVVVLVRHWIAPPKQSSMMFLNVLLAVTGVVLIALFIYFKKPQQGEHFTGPIFSSSSASTGSASSIDLTKILQIYGMQNGGNAPSAQQLMDTIETNYNENLSSIQSGLTTYYSAFGKKGFQAGGSTWYNLSPFFNVPNTTCPDVRVDMTNAQFSQPPTSYSRETGFPLGKIMITGPKSHQLGITGNGSFALFFTIKFNSFEPQGKTLELLKLFANTNNNNGLTISVSDPKPHGGPTSYTINLDVQYGTQDKISNPIDINFANSYMFVLVKDSLNLSLFMYPNIDVVTSNPMGQQVIFSQFKLDPLEDVLLSNREMLINSQKNIYAQIFNFGIYNRALDSQNVSQVFSFTQAEIQKSNEMLKSLASQISALQAKIDSAKACPYTDDSVCKTCTTVNDWSNSGSIISGATSDCLQTIDQYCVKNPKDPNCACWDTANAINKTAQCTNYVNIFRQTTPLNVDSIPSETLDIIKSKYKLCNCADTDKELSKSVYDALKKYQTETAMKASGAVTSIVNGEQVVTAIDKKKRLQFPMSMGISEYKIVPDFIQLFDNMPINNLFRERAPILKRRPSYVEIEMPM